MPNTRPLKVFLCHATADKPAVRKLYRYLRSKGMQPWLDAENLLPGENWEVEIPNALLDSDVILVCLSKNSVNKEGYVQKEITFALDKALEKPEGTIFVIPAKLEECDVPPRLSRFQWVDMHREDGRKRLMLSLNKRAAQLGPAVKQAVVADELTEKTERDAVEKAAREKAEREAKEKAERAAAEKLALENAERENAEKAAREKADREAKEKAERTAAEKLALESAERENAEKVACEKADREAKEKADLAAAKKLALEKAEREKAVGQVSNLTDSPSEKASRTTSPTYKYSSPRETKPEPSSSLKILGIGLTAIAFIALVIWGVSSLTAPPETTQTPFATQTLLAEPAMKTPVPATSTAIIIPTPTLGIGSTIIGEDGAVLIYVPEGEFTMGSDSNSDEKPIHTVYLDAFWIDRTEVTNKQYAACVSGGGCTPLSNTISYTRSSYYGNSEFDEFPVIYVDWNQAKAYCDYAGRDLPTEAQWEKAARGTDARIYPWGNAAPNDTLLNYNQTIGDTTKVGSYETGKSFYGAYDMAGNVWEWVNDWYQSDYYAALGDKASNPQGPSSGDGRVLRGGSWNYNNFNVRSAIRNRHFPASTLSYLGFRCSRSLPVP